MWYKTSYLLDTKQSFNGKAAERYENYKKQPVEWDFRGNGIADARCEGTSRPKAAIIREKGTNGEREMAYSLYLAGFDVKDVMMTDLISGRATSSVPPRDGLVPSSSTRRLRKPSTASMLARTPCR